MKINVEEELKKLKDLLQPVIKGFSPQKKAYCLSILDKIIAELNYRDSKFLAFQSKSHGFKSQDDFLDNFEMYSDLFALCGGSDIDYMQLRKDCIDWMLLHSPELTKPFTFDQILKVHEHLSLYRMMEEKWPNDFKELKEYITKEFAQ